MQTVENFRNMLGFRRASVKVYNVRGKTIQEERPLSEGAFAFVYEARDLASNEYYALKKILCQEEDRRELARREIQFLESIPAHPHIVGYFGSTINNASKKDAEAIILMELCTGGHLLDLLEKHSGTLQEPTIVRILTEILSGLAHMHGLKSPIAHRDLKVENILLDRSGKVKICDFGSCSSSFIDTMVCTKQELLREKESIEAFTTMIYRAPEMIDLHRRYVINEKVDIWMVGCILFTLMFYRHPFQDESPLAIANGKFEIPTDRVYNQKLTDVLLWMLTVSPKDRPSAATLLDVFKRYYKIDTIDLPPVALENSRAYYQRVASDREFLQKPITQIDTIKAGRKLRQKDGQRNGKMENSDNFRRRLKEGKSGLQESASRKKQLNRTHLEKETADWGVFETSENVKGSATTQDWFDFNQVESHVNEEGIWNNFNSPENTDFFQNTSAAFFEEGDTFDSAFQEQSSGTIGSFGDGIFPTDTQDFFSTVNTAPLEESPSFDAFANFDVSHIDALQALSDASTAAGAAIPSTSKTLLTQDSLVDVFANITFHTTAEATTSSTPSPTIFNTPLSTGMPKMSPQPQNAADVYNTGTSYSNQADLLYSELANIVTSNNDVSAPPPAYGAPQATDPIPDFSGIYSAPSQPTISSFEDIASRKNLQNREPSILDSTDYVFQFEEGGSFKLPEKEHDPFDAFSFDRSDGILKVLENIIDKPEESNKKATTENK